METLVQYKFAIKDKDSFEKLAKSKNIKFSNETTHAYTYFEVPSEKDSFTVLRIKETDKKKSTDMKIRNNKTGEWQHFETKIENPEQLKNIFKNIGCKPIVTFHKSRKTHIGEFIRLDLDTTKELGTFLEVKFSLNKKEEVEKFLTKLGVDISKSDKRSVIEIYLSKRKSS